MRQIQAPLLCYLWCEGDERQEGKSYHSQSQSTPTFKQTPTEIEALEANKAVVSVQAQMLLCLAGMEALLP